MHQNFDFLSSVQTIQKSHELSQCMTTKQNVLRSSRRIAAHI